MYYFILNPSSHSNGSRKTWNEVLPILQAESIPYRVFSTHYPGHGTAIARDITERDPEAVIVAIGGDGTVHDVLSGLTHMDGVTFGLIPSGSGNDFARGMGLARDTAEAIETVLHPKKTIAMDVGEIRGSEGGRFGVSCGIGFDASVCHEALSSKLKSSLNHLHLGELTYTTIAAKQLLTYEPGPMTVQCDGGEALHLPRAFFAAVMNQKYEGGGFRFCPAARTDDGVLDVIVAENISRLRMLLSLPFAMPGLHTGFRGIHIYRCKSIEIRTDRRCAVHIDGESGGLQKILQAGVEPSSIRIMLPRES